MKIIIVGAGQTGAALAEYLVVDNQNDITLIDVNPQRLKSLQDRYDLQAIEGRGSYPEVLSQAGAESADMIVAVTNSDETNMLACYICDHLFHLPKKVARLRAPEYNDKNYPLFSHEDRFPIDHIIAPEQIITNHIRNLITYKGALQVDSFCDQQLFLIASMAYYGGSLVGSELSELSEHLPYVDVKVIAIYRKNRLIRPIASTIIEAGDLVYFVTIKANIKAIIGELQRLEKPSKRIMISGGDNIALTLAKQLEQDYQVKLIESNTKRAEIIADQLSATTVLNGDASDHDFLSQEQVELIDVFLAVTHDDEANIMSAMLAKRMGAKKVIILVQRQAYLDLINESSIDIALSPQQASISELFGYVRGSNIIKVVPLNNNQAQVVEVSITSKEGETKVLGKAINEIKLPSSVVVAALVRNDDVIIIEDNDLILQADDHLILLLPSRKMIGDIEKLFA